MGGKGQKTRSDILMAGARLFSLHGYSETSMNDILENTSISKGAFYYHFKSKRDMVIAVLEKLREDYEREVFEPVRARPDPAERFKNLLGLLSELSESGRWDYCRLLGRLTQEFSRQEDELGDEIAETMKWVVDFWAEVIEDAQAAAALRDDIAAKALAELGVTLYLGAISQQTKSADEATDLRELLHNFYTLLIR
ncbi:MAG: TetR/AcrR family transcriptional regulator [Sedimentisphaerales bacterium]|nr:TetR/AcrR family transcriptional regulator [Sedimentisphaerales bacterium]